MQRWDVINDIMERYVLKSFLEIGTFNGECFNRIKCEHKACIDPNFDATYKMTSDKYFAIMPGPIAKWDVIFVDALHTAEQAYKDIVNSYKILNSGGFIIVHDCNPETEFHARPPEEYKIGEEWNGDVYKSFSIFKIQHPELSCFVIGEDYGVGIITSRPILKNINILSEWDYFDKNRDLLLQLTTAEKFINILE